MSIIRKGVTKLGSYSMKKVYTKTLTADEDGEVSESALAVVTIPQYCHLGYLWLDIDVVGQKTAIDPHKFMEFAIRGSVADVRLDADEGSIGENWETIMKYNMPADPDAATNPGAVAAEDMGITGREHVADYGHEFFRRECILGLPNYAYPSNAEGITYKAHFKYKGHARTKNMTNIGTPKVLAIGALATVPDMVTDKGDSQSGGYTDMLTFYEALRDNIPAVGGEGSVTTGDALPASLENYLYKGLQHDDFTDAHDLNVRMYLTARIDVYEPQHARYTPAP